MTLHTFISCYMKDLGEARKILCMEIERDRKGKKLWFLRVAMWRKCWRGLGWINQTGINSYVTTFQVICFIMS